MNNAFQPATLFDTVPSVAHQCSNQGWEFGIWDNPDAMNTFRFNPCIVPFQDKLLLIERRTRLPSTFSDIVACELGEGMTRGDPFQIHWGHHDLYLEDPRVVQDGDGFQIWCVCYKPAPKKIPVPMQGVAKVGPDGNVEWFDVPDLGNNTRRPEKNWCPLPDAKRFVYHVRDHIVIDIESHERWETPGISWPHGEARGGTPAFEHNGQYLSLFHSCTTWKVDPIYGPRMRYYVGAYTFEMHPPFRITSFTKQPILIGSGQGPAIRMSPAVVFPTGAIPFGDDILITAGINDVRSAWVKIPFDHMDQMLEPA